MRQMIPVLLLLTLLLPAAAAAQPPVTRAQFVAALWACAGGVPYDANGPFSDVERLWLEGDVFNHTFRVEIPMDWGETS